MKKIIFLFLLLLISKISYSKSSIDKIEMYAISYMSFFYTTFPLNDVYRNGIYVKITNQNIINNSHIPLYISDLNKVDDNEYIAYFEEEFLDDLEARLILNIFKNEKKETYLFLPAFSDYGIYCLTNKTLYKGSPELFKAVYSFYPQDFYSYDD